MKFNLNNTVQYPLFFSVIMVLATLLFLHGCSDGPREEYTKLCVDVAKTARQRQACTCLAYEYGRVLTPDEYHMVNIMLGRSINGLREKKGKTDGPVTVDKTGIDENIYLSAMKKIALLQRSGVCGYNQKQ